MKKTVVGVDVSMASAAIIFTAKTEVLERFVYLAGLVVCAIAGVYITVRIFCN